MRVIPLSVAVVAAFVVSAVESRAGVIATYTSRSAFDAAVGTTTLETFNSFTVNTHVPFPGALDIGPFTITKNDFFEGLVRVVPESSFNVDGTPNLKTNTFLNHDLTLTFDTAITSFGADFAGFNESLALRTNILAGSDTIAAPNTGGSNAVRFFGFQSDTAFTTLTFKGVLSDGFGVDNVAFGSNATVPEPTSLAIFGIGACVAGIGAGRRRRHETQQEAAA